MSILYNTKLIRQRSDKSAKEKIESFDAIVDEVLVSQRLCRVYVQGSSTPLFARFPQNWKLVPDFLKAGNSVRVICRGGNRTIFEITGHGRNLPTFPQGSPTAIVLPVLDTILSGMELIVTAGTMSIAINSGIYRINGITYEVGGMIAGDGILAGNHVLAGGQIDVVTLTAPSAGYYKYVLIVIGTDGIVDVINGSQTTGEPSMPAVPSGHIKLGHVFLWGGVTAIQSSMINQYYEAPYAASLVASSNVEEMDWLVVTPATITIQVKDQRGNLFPYTGYISAVFELGNGSLTNTNDWGSSPFWMVNGQVLIRYYREGQLTDISPRIKISVDGYETFLWTYVLIALLDSSGEIML